MEEEFNLTESYLLSTSGNTKIILNHPKFTIGRALNNSYVLENIEMSRNHCIFEEINGAWCLTDLSSNGTFVNQRRVRSRTPQMLTNNDIIKFCDNLEFVFINKNSDSLDNIDLSDVIDDAVIKCTDYVIEVTTSDINDIGGPSTSSEHVTYTNTEKPQHCTIINADHTSDTTESVIVPNLTNICCANNTNVCKQPQSENRVNEQPQSSINNDALEQVEDELQCIICTELFIKATTLNCSHSFCKYCIEEWQKKSKNCPICRTKIITTIPTIVLDNCIAKVLESASDDLKKKREEIIKSREKPETVPPIIIRAGKVLRTRNIIPIEISSEEENSYEDDDFDMDEYDGDDDDDYNGVPGRYYGGYGRCYSCGERGHWSNGCPYR